MLEPEIMDDSVLARFAAASGRFDCVLDIGACHGVLSIAAHAAGSQAIAVEPVSYNFKRIMQVADERPGIIPVCAAVKARSGDLVVMRAAGNQGQCSSLYLEHFAPIGAAVTIGINDLLRQVQPDAIKIDVEGDEWEIMAALDPGLLTDVRWLDIELHDLRHEDYYGADAGADMCDIAAILAAAGFHVDGNPLTGERPCGHLTAIRADLAAAA